MAPNISRHNYPIATGLCQLSPSSGHAKDDFPQLNSLTSLAHLDKKPMDDYLKQVMRHLKGAFEIYPKSTICIKIQQLKKLPHPTTLQALGILNQGLLQSHILLKNVIQLGSDPEIGEGEIAKLKKLKERLLTLTRFLDGIFMYYSNSCMGCKAPLVEEIKCTAKKLYKVINSMKPDKLNDYVLKYPYTEELNKWFTVSVERDKDDGDGVVKTNVRIINTTHATPEETSRLIQEELRKVQQQQPGKFYYHGTDHDGAKSILENGINLEVGKRGSDFSDGEGFYLTESHDFAKKWSLGKNKIYNAVLVFNISENHLSGYKCVDLNPSDRRTDWKNVTEYYGLKKKKNKNKNKNAHYNKLIRDCENCDFIIGPMSRDGCKENPGVVYEQICIKKKPMANSIGNPANICAVIFNIIR